MSLKHWQAIWGRFVGKGIYPHELSFVLDNPLRQFILPAARLAKTLDLSPTSRVLEIGPGPGYFSVEVAKQLPDGLLILFDIQREMLVKSRAKLRRAGLLQTPPVQTRASDQIGDQMGDQFGGQADDPIAKNPAATAIGFAQGNAAALPFRPASFDRVFLVTVLGEVADPETCIACIAEVLRPGGLLSVTEQAGDPDALTEAALETMASRHGFIEPHLTLFRGGFTLNLRRPPTAAPATGE
jgi:ubiquinone/menaquinone biosynthesis C-methylase UbiE